MVSLADHSIAIIVLAAGQGRRMGTQPKLLLPWRDGESILWHATRNALSLQPIEVVVVVRPDLPEMVLALGDLPVSCMPNTLYEEGMSTSLAAGIKALGDDVEAALLMLGDEPFVDRRIMEGLAQAYLAERKPITIPQYGEQIGPPALFARQIFPELMKLQGDVGGRQIVDRYPEMVCRVSFSEQMRPHDIDTQRDYQAIL